MTTAQFAAKVRAKYPGAYDSLDDATLVSKIVAKHPQYGAQITDNPDIQPVMAHTSNVQPDTDEPGMLDATVNDGQLVMGAAGLAKGLGGLAMKAGPAIADGLGAIPKIAGDAWDAMSGNTPAGLGFAKSARATPGLRDMASDAIDYANSAQPEVGKLVENAAAPAEGIVPYGTELPPTTPVDTAAFQQPIRGGVMTNPQAMYDAAETQQQALGKAIEGTLSKLDATGTHYDPTNVVNQVKGMLEKDAAGDIMTTGVQGEKNDAINHALASLRDFSKGGTINWSDAARIKSALQDSANYAAKANNISNEAYKQVASLLKEDIDNQAQSVLEKAGGNVEDFQKLRQAYGTTTALKNALNNKLASATGSVPAWVKMGLGAMGGSYLGGKVASVVKGLTN